MRSIAATTICLVLAGCGANASVGSIGAVLGRDNDDQAVYVRDVPDGLAAAEAGLQPGDEVVMLDGIYVRTLSAVDLRAKLRGEIGSKLAMTVVRGDRVIRVELRRTPLSGVQIKPKAKEEKITE